MREGETTPVSPSGFRTRFTRVPRGRRAPAGILAESPPLLGRSLHRDYGNCDAIFSLGAVFDFAVMKREEGVVAADADIGARVPFSAALAHDDLARRHGLAAENLHAEPATSRVAPVA